MSASRTDSSGGEGRITQVRSKKEELGKEISPSLGFFAAVSASLFL